VLKPDTWKPPELQKFLKREHWAFTYNAS
jgi:hypothetical protein